LLLDETRLRQILFNVVGNAVKFTDEGDVKLSIHKIPSSADPGRIDMVFKVEDTGIGIPGDQIENIFQAFEQRKGQPPHYGGTGLGLAIAKQIVDGHFGNISVITLHRGTREEVISQCRDCAETALDLGSIIVGGSNLIMPGTPPENIIAMVETLEKYH
jgi:signal transduction histidine kinase